MKKQGTFRTELVERAQPRRADRLHDGAGREDRRHQAHRAERDHLLAARHRRPRLSVHPAQGSRRQVGPGQAGHRLRALLHHGLLRGQLPLEAQPELQARQAQEQRALPRRDLRAGDPGHLGRRGAVPLRRRLLVRRHRRQHRPDQARHAAAAHVRDPAADYRHGAHLLRPERGLALQGRARAHRLHEERSTATRSSSRRTTRTASPRKACRCQEFWEAGLGAGTWTGWYLDPKDEKAFGPNAKNYKYDLAEAKKLVEAAGLKTPLDFTSVCTRSSRRQRSRPASTSAPRSSSA